eukprot:1149959-Pelagomonas_calceolata.AAC.8
MHYLLWELRTRLPFGHSHRLYLSSLGEKLTESSLCFYNPAIIIVLGVVEWDDYCHPLVIILRAAKLLKMREMQGVGFGVPSAPPKCLFGKTLISDHPVEGKPLCVELDADGRQSEGRGASWTAWQGARGVANCYAAPTQQRQQGVSGWCGQMFAQLWLMRMAAQFPHITEAAGWLLSTHVMSCARTQLGCHLALVAPRTGIAWLLLRTKHRSCEYEKQP